MHISNPCPLSEIIQKGKGEAFKFQWRNLVTEKDESRREIGLIVVLVDSGAGQGGLGDSKGRSTFYLQIYYWPLPRFCVYVCVCMNMSLHKGKVAYIDSPYFAWAEPL